jgi:hypothetical protein
MRCPHFHGTRYPLCSAVDGLFSPPLSRIERYCDGGSHEVCPIYRLREESGHHVPLDALEETPEPTRPVR